MRGAGGGGLKQVGGQKVIETEQTKRHVVPMWMSPWTPQSKQTGTWLQRYPNRRKNLTKEIHHGTRAAAEFVPTLTHGVPEDSDHVGKFVREVRDEVR